MNSFRFHIVHAAFLLISHMGLSGGPSLDAQSTGSGNPFGFDDIRPKFLEIKFSTLPQVGQYPYGEYREVDKYEINRVIDAKLTLPMVLKDRVQVVGRVRHKNELLNLGEIRDVYDRDIHLKHTGIGVFYKISIGRRLFASGHVGGSLKGDVYREVPLSRLLDYNTSFIIVHEHPEKHSRKGVGLVMGNSLGRFNILPVLIYDTRLGSKWLLEMRLPKKASLRHILRKDNLYLLIGAEASGASYALSNEVFPGHIDTEYRRLQLDISAGIEKELHDWLWFGLYAGASQPFGSFFVPRGQRSAMRLHNLRPGFAPFASFSIFAVPPRSLFNR